MKSRFLSVGWLTVFAFALLVLQPAANTANAATPPILQKLTAVEQEAIGPLWSVSEPGTWKGFWVKRKDTGPIAVYDATWKNASGTAARDVLYVQSWNAATRQVTFWRQGNGGRYFGVLKGDTLQGGTASWYAAGWTWSGFIIRLRRQAPDDLKGTVGLR